MPAILSAAIFRVLRSIPPTRDNDSLLVQSMMRRRSKLMAPRVFSIAAAVFTSLAAISSAAAFKDPHNKFCGNEECYSVLGLTRGADKAEIKKAYRAISLDVHPDKNPSPAAKEKFTVRGALLCIPPRSLPRFIHHSQTLPPLDLSAVGTFLTNTTTVVLLLYCMLLAIIYVCGVVLAQRDIYTWERFMPFMPPS